MREIMFRGKHKYNGEWVYGYLIGNDVIVGDIVEFNDEYFNTEFWYKVDPQTVGQYTGLKDRNGQEIYEGDILENEHGNKFFIHYFIPDCKFMSVLVESYGNEDQYELDEYLDPWVYCEVIGNISDNPELLKGDESE